MMGIVPINSAAASAPGGAAAVSGCEQLQMHLLLPQVHSHVILLCSA
jgi:hypothetical protein